MSTLHITTVQAKLHWENATKNLKHFSSLLKSVKPSSTDVIVLPEMFSTGFSMNVKNLAEKMNGPSMQWMHHTAEVKNAVVCGSLIIEEAGKYFNRLIWMTPGGVFAHYDKRHLFRMADEQNFYHAGDKRLIILHKGWRIAPFICYDLRFPVWLRNQRDYDCAIVVANWPEKRSFAWKQLLIARAIENQAFYVGVNRVGKDGNVISYTGDTVALDPFGKKISKTKAGVEQVETITLDFDTLENARHIFPVGNDADTFTIKF